MCFVSRNNLFQGSHPRHAWVGRYPRSSARRAPQGEYCDSVTAVLILANGTVPRVIVGIDYALSTLSNLFPKSLASNIAFMWTNISSPLHLNFSWDTVPDVLKDAPLFLFNNPIALQKKYLRLRDSPHVKTGTASFCKAVKASEESALDMLVELFDWLDGLEPQPTTVGNVNAIADTHPPMDQTVASEANHPAVSSSTCLHLARRSSLILIGNRT